MNFLDNPEFWDEVVDRNLDKLDLEVFPIESGSIVEIDTVEELIYIREKGGHLGNINI